VWLLKELLIAALSILFFGPNELQLLAVPKARIENFCFGQFLILSKELSLAHSILHRLT
jgi:hypothetical protein